MRKFSIQSLLPAQALAFLVLGLVTMTLSACNQKVVTKSVPMTEPAKAANPAGALGDMQGQALFVANCIQCHSGGGSPPGPNAVILDSERLNTEESFRSLLRQPTSAMMKSFTPEELSDANVHRLYTFLIGFRQPTKD